MDTWLLFIAFSKNYAASLWRIEAVITINKNRRASHIVQIVPFNLISGDAVDSKERTISRWAVWYPAPASAIIWGSVASRCWPAHSSCQRTRGVCWSSQWDKTRGGMMSSNDMSRVFFPRQSDEWNVSLRAGSKSEFNFMWLACDTDSLRATFNRCYGLFSYCSLIQLNWGSPQCKVGVVMEWGQQP